jgi:hypothetical protein
MNETTPDDEALAEKAVAEMCEAVHGLADVMDGRSVIISRKSLNEMYQALMDADEDGMTQEAECMVEARVALCRTVKETTNG